jgi:RNA:NAD 2'-phosphotransferase (TPT1/KptA family)
MIWTEYLRHRARVRGFDLAVIEQIVRFSRERYFDTDTRRMVAIGRHGRWLVLVPYDQDEQTLTPVTIHATTRQQLTLRLRRGRLVP